MVRVVLDHDASIIDDGNPVGQKFRFGQVMGTDNNCPPVITKLKNRIANELGAVGIHGRSRLIKQENAGVMEHRPNDADLLAHAFGILPQASISGAIRHAKAVEQFQTPFFDLFIRHSVNATKKEQVFQAIGATV